MIALVAWRGGPDAKSRLAGVLSPEGRADLAGLMLDRVLSALRSARSIDRICVVSPMRPPDGDAAWVRDDGMGMNAAFALALAEIETGPVLLLPADLPMLRGATVDALVAMHDDFDVVIAPDRTGEGTNALLLDDPKTLVPAFGLASFGRHVTLARGTGAQVGILESEDIAFDIDLPRDLTVFQQAVGIYDHA